MGSIAGECPRSQASATCDGVALWRSATSSRGPPGLASLPVASGYQGMNPTSSRSQAGDVTREGQGRRPGVPQLSKGGLGLREVVGG